MAEYCKDCAKEYLEYPHGLLDRAAYSPDLELCEGCGEMKHVLVELDAPLWKRILFGGRN